MKRFFLFGLVFSPVCFLLAQEQSPRYDKLEPFQEGMAMVSKGNAYGFVDRDLKEVIPPVYFSACPFAEGVAAVAVNDANGVFTWVFIDRTDKQAVPGEYESNWSIGFSNGLATVKKNGKVVVINKKGEVILTPKDSVVSPFQYGLAEILGNNERYGVINLKGEIVVPTEFYRTQVLSSSLVQVTNDKWQSGLYNSYGQKLTSLVYEKIDTLRNGLVRVAANGKYGLFNKEGKALVATIYDEISDFEEGLASVNRDLKWGFIDEQGEEVIAVKYDQVEGFVHGKAYISGNYNYSYINKKGKPVKSGYSELEMPRAKTKEAAEKFFLDVVNGLASTHPSGEEGPAIIDSAFTIHEGILLGSFREYTTSGLVIRKLSIPVAKITEVWYDANMGIRLTDEAALIQSTRPGGASFEKKYTSSFVHLASPGDGSHGFRWKEKLELALAELKRYYL